MDEAEREGRKTQASARSFSTPRIYLDPATEDIVGKKGEHQFALEFGIAMESIFGKGDGGRDFDLGFGIIDVKTSQFRKHLLVKACDINKPVAIYVCATYNKEADLTLLNGWEFGGTMSRQPKRDFKRKGTTVSLVCHYMLIDHLKPIALLHEYRDFWKGECDATPGSRTVTPASEAEAEA